MDKYQRIEAARLARLREEQAPLPAMCSGCRKPAKYHYGQAGAAVCASCAADFCGSVDSGLASGLLKKMEETEMRPPPPAPPKKFPRRRGRPPLSPVDRARKQWLRSGR